MFALMPWRKERKGPTNLAPRTESTLDLFRGEMEDWFDRLFGRWPVVFEPAWPKGLEVEEKEGEVLVRMDAPGFEPCEFNIEVTGEALTVVAEHKAEVKGKEEAKV